MNYALFDKYRVVMRRHMTAFAAAALVNSDINKDSSVPHLRQILFLEEFWSGATGNQYRADNEIRILYHPRNI